jgi:hypothetical protein
MLVAQDIAHGIGQLALAPCLADLAFHRAALGRDVKLDHGGGGQVAHQRELG